MLTYFKGNQHKPRFGTLRKFFIVDTVIISAAVKKLWETTMSQQPNEEFINCKNLCAMKRLVISLRHKSSYEVYVGFHKTIKTSR